MIMNLAEKQCFFEIVEMNLFRIGVAFFDYKIDPRDRSDDRQFSSVARKAQVQDD